MKCMRSVRWLLLALMVFAVVAQQRASAQAPGTLRTGTFVWDGARWMPVENPEPPPEAAPAQDADDEDVTADVAPPLREEVVQPPPLIVHVTLPVAPPLTLLVQFVFCDP